MRWGVEPICAVLSGRGIPIVSGSCYEARVRA